MSSNIEHSLLIYDVTTPTTVTSVGIEQLSGCLSDAREVGKKNNILIAERNQHHLTPFLTLLVFLSRTVKQFVNPLLKGLKSLAL